jgi:hypothetical protein
MPGNLRKGRRLLVISDTDLIISKKERKGYEPVVRELDIIADLFDEIIWLGIWLYPEKYSCYNSIVF